MVGKYGNTQKTSEGVVGDGVREDSLLNGRREMNT